MVVKGLDLLSSIKHSTQESAANAIQFKYFNISKTFYPTQIADLLEWLCLTPPTTTVRVNILNTQPEALRAAIEAKLQKLHPATAVPDAQPLRVRVHPKLPELITISAVRPSLSADGAAAAVDTSLGEVIVDIACGASILRGAHLYAPGVVAMPAQTAIGERVNVYADVEGGCLKGANAAVYVSERKVFVGVGVVRMQRYQLFGPNLTPR